MVEEYVVRDDEVDLMHDVKPVTLDNLTDGLITKLVQRAENNHMELQNLIDYIIYPHSHEEITTYAMALKHRLEEK